MNYIKKLTIWVFPENKYEWMNTVLSLMGRILKNLSRDNELAAGIYKEQGKQRGLCSWS